MRKRERNLNSRLRFGCLGVLVWLAALSVQLTAAQPEIQIFLVPSQARLMDEVSLTALASDAGTGRNLVYQWRIVDDPTGRAQLGDAGNSTARLQLWWESAANAQQDVGKVVVVELEVSFADAGEGDESAVRTGQVEIVGVNHPPTAVITGNLGTPQERIPAGTNIQVSSWDSSDPDGDSLRAEWGFGSRSGGRFLSQLVMIGSDSRVARFTVPPMDAPIDQVIVLNLINGLHRVQAQAVAYLTPESTSPPPPTNQAPTLTLSPSQLTVQKSQNAEFVATANDVNGDDLVFTWLLNSNSVPEDAVILSSRVSGSTTEWRSTLRLPTDTLQAGTYSISVKAKEARVSPLESPTRFATLTVVSGGGGSQTGYFNEVRGSCGGNSGPQLVSIVPDPRIAEILVSPGQDVTVELVFQDSSQAEGYLGQIKQGVEAVTWDLAALQAKGITAQTNLQAVPSNPQQARSRLTFQAPVGVTSGEARVTATAQDVLQCTSSVTFGLVFVSGGSSPPTAAIRVDHDGDGDFDPVTVNGQSFDVDRTEVNLDASGSQPGGAGGNLSYTWTTSTQQATLSSPNSPQTTVQVPAGFTGSVTVTLEVRDASDQSSTLNVVLNFQNAASVPVARIMYSETGPANYSGPFAPGHLVTTTKRTIYLDGGASTDPGGGTLSYSWAVTGIQGAAVDPANARTTVLTVPAGVTGTATVTLQVTNPQDRSSSTSIRFQYLTAADPPTVTITKFPTKVSVGEEFTVSAVAVTGGGSGSFQYSWSAQCCGGVAVPVFNGGSQAKIVAPELPPDADSETLTISVVASEDGIPSDPAEVEITLEKPTLVFSQLGVGPVDAQRTLETSVVLVNPSDVEAVAEVAFFQGSGDNGELPWEVVIDGEPGSTAELTIEPGGAREVVVSGETIAGGWMQLTANVRLTGHLFYRVRRIGTTGPSGVLLEVPILPVTGRAFRTALSPGRNGNVALALVNIGNQPIEFTIVVRQTGGFEIETANIPLAPGEHMARFLSEVMEDYAVPLPDSFKGGTLMIRLAPESQGPLAVTIIKTTPDEGLPFSILPVATQ